MLIPWALWFLSNLIIFTWKPNNRVLPKNMRYIATIILWAFLLVPVFARVNGNEWISTTRNAQWNTRQFPDMHNFQENSDVEIFMDAKLQVMEGFGACFNELGWISLQSLSRNDRETVLRELFEPGYGSNFTLCRMPLGANDFSRNWYSYDETAGDFDLKHFSIANDLLTLVPFIQQAKKFNPQLRIWASPWSPPAWMKYNKHYACATSPADLDKKFRNGLDPEKQGKEGANMFIQEDRYFSTYAMYFARFIEEYHHQGIDISTIMPQNEFNSCQIFPSCTWTSPGLARFIGQFLGPEMEKRHVDIMFGTMERPDGELVDIILKDKLAGKYIKGIGFQWAGKDAIAGIHNEHPEMKLYQTEQECGDGKNNWPYCRYSWDLMKHYILHGASAYMYWNISLFKDGYSRWGWQQNSLITVDSVQRTFAFNYEYYLMKHLSHFVKPGARLLKTGGLFDNLLAFINPDNSIVLLLQNETSGKKTVNIKVGNKQISPELEPDSFNTILIKNE
jgi:glucosylceramidase